MPSDASTVSPSSRKIMYCNKTARKLTIKAPPPPAGPSSIGHPLTGNDAYIFTPSATRALPACASA
jgi:hypothetical protein